MLSRLREVWARAPWLVLAAVVVIVLMAARLGTREDAWYATGYVETAREMIDSGYVRLDCDSMRITTRFPRGSAQERWFSLSYLREDVRRFNSDPERVPGPFLVETDQECRLLGVDRYYHRIDLPYNRLVDWQGDVLLSGGHTSAVLESRSIPQSIHVRPPESTADAARSWEASPQQPGALPLTAFFRMRPWPSGPVVSELYFVGQDLVLADRRDEGAPFDIRVGGHPLLPGRVVRIETGDWVQFGFRTDAGRVRPGTAPRLYTYLSRVGSDSRLASFVRVQNDDVDRLFSIPHLQSFLEPFTQAMSSTVQNSDALRARGVANGQDSVVLTLDQALGDALHARTLEWCRQNSAPSGLRAVSMLVMDAFSGAVRAIPSCPSVDQADALAGLSPAERERWLRNQNLVRHPIGSAGKPFWAAALASASPNLLDLQIPEHPGGEVSRALGCPLPAGYEDHPHSGPGGWVGIEGFLAASCNAYIVELATGALAVGGARARSGAACSGQLSAADFASCFPAPPAGDSAAQLRVCDQVVRTVLLPGTQFTGGDCNQLKQVGTDFDAIQNLYAVTNVEWYYRGAPAGVVSGAGPRRGARADTAGGETALEQGYRYGRYRIDVWRRVTDAFASVDRLTPPVESRLRFAAVSPEQTNLGLNSLDQLRGEWVNVLLGGSTSRWSNFQLAEAMARLMSGRAVQGEFVDSVQGRWMGAAGAQINARREFDFLPASVLHPGARRRVLHGMELVVEQGTASQLRALSSALRDSLERAPGGPYDLYLFAKTGTPNIAKRVPSAGQRFVAQLAPHLRWDPGSRRIAPTPAGTRVLADAARRTPRLYRWFEREVRAPLEAAPDYFRARSDDAAPPHPLYLVGDNLRLNRRNDREVVRQGGVLVFGIMAVPRVRGRAAAAGQADWVSACTLDPSLRSRILQVPRPEALDVERTVALSVAIFVDDLDIGQGSGKAVELAAAAFPELQTYVLSQVRERARRSVM